MLGDIYFAYDINKRHNYHLNIVGNIFVIYH